MEHKINTELHLIVTRDNTIDQEYARKQQLAHIGNVATGAYERFTGAAGQVYGVIKDELAIRVHDAVYDTDLTAQRQTMRDAVIDERAKRRFGIKG